MAIVLRLMLVAVTDHAAERFRQRVRATLDEKTEIASAVARHREIASALARRRVGYRESTDV